MKYNYEFINLPEEYLLRVNNSMAVKRYPKSKYSKQEAESNAWDYVQQKINRYGLKNISYAGTYLQ